MDTQSFLKRYKNSPWVLEFCRKLHSSTRGDSFAIKGLVGSLDAVLLAAIYSNSAKNNFIIARDRDEAQYLYSDINNLLHKNTLFYTHIESSEVDDMKATISRIARAEVYSILSTNAEPQIIITYPEALLFKEISSKILQEHTLHLKKSDQTTISDLEKKLLDQGFVKTDFVYSPGEYALRGGIFDIFSYNAQLPYRLEFSGNEIEEIRVFHPENQCSLNTVDKISILSKLDFDNENIEYESILNFLPEKSSLWIKDYELVVSLIEKKYDSEDKSGESKASFEDSLKRHISVEYGNRFYLKKATKLDYNSTAQVNFKQNIPLLVDSLEENLDKGFEPIIVAETQYQLDRVQEILDNNIVYAEKIELLQLGLAEAYIDNELNIALYTDHQIFDRFYRPKAIVRYSKSKALTFKELQNIETGDYIVHSDFGIGKFAGLTKRNANGNQQEAIRIIYKDNDIIYVGLQSLHKISKYRSKDGITPNISKLGTTTWDQKKQKVKSKVKDIAESLIRLYCKRREAPGFSFKHDTAKQVELESSFMYEDTPDQSSATAAVKKDMEAPHPMDRLVCGDVGFGKTEVAIRAAFKAVQDKKQVAVLVPTTILALQHYNSFSSRLSKLGINVDYVSRFRSAKETKNILERTAQGSVDILIGTHKILSKSILFKDLGLLIIDEEQKFGVTAKERIKEMKLNVDILTLTATPIPRTMHFSLMGAKDLSLITTPPANRQPIQTKIHSFDKELIADAINFELQRLGQVIFVHNKVANIETIASMIRNLVPSCNVDIIHGQMLPAKVEKAIVAFMEQKTNVLLATSIIESGIDMPNANTLIVNDAHKFGLSDLHQMRGRVGRSSQKAYCYLLAPPSSEMSSVARRRLSALEEFSDLGDGFKIAMRDLDIRGAGDLLGAEQSGFIADVGFETYCQILDEAVTELKDNEFKSIFGNNETVVNKKVMSCSIESDFEALIPESFVSNTAERIQLYTRLDSLQTSEELEIFITELIDRFGLLPKSFLHLVELLKLRWFAQTIGVNELYLLKGAMKCVFNNESLGIYGHFGSIVQYVQKNPKNTSLKTLENQLVLHVNNVDTIDGARKVIESLK